CPTYPNGTPTCTAGSCGIACNVGYGDCDGILSNGCESNLNTNSAHCGTCITACPSYPNSTPTCTAGACGVACNGGYGDCDGIASTGCETNLNTNATHCGTCPTVCPSYPNSSPTCAAGACGIACSAGFGDCDGMAGTGCEAN